MATFTSVQIGDWTDGATWGNNSPGVKGTDFPGNLDTVYVDHFVEYTAGVSTDITAILDIRDGGILNFPVDANSTLRIQNLANAFLVRSGGELRMGTAIAPIQSPYVAKVSFVYPTAIRTIGYFYNGSKISMFGDPSFYGGEFKAYLKQNWISGTTFYVEGDFSDKWKPGQYVWMSRLGPYVSITFNTMIRQIASVGAYDVAEDRTPITISGTFPTGPWNTTDSQGEQRSVVLNFSRNVEWFSEGINDNPYGHSAYSQRVRPIVEQSIENNNLHFDNVLFHGMHSFVYASVAVSYNIVFNESVFFNCNAFVSGGIDLTITKNIFSSTAGLTNCSVKEDKLSSDNWFVGNATAIIGFNFDMDYFLSFNNNLGINGSINTVKRKIGYWYTQSNATDCSGAFRNLEVDKYISISNGVTCIGGTLVAGTGKFSIEFFDIEIWYPTGTAVFTLNGAYLTGKVVMSSGANIFTLSNNFVAEDLVITNENPSNSSRFVNACNNFVLRNVEMNVCDYVFYGSTHSFLVFIKIGTAQGLAFFRGDVYDGRISGEIDNINSIFFYDTVRNVYFINAKINTINNWFRNTTSFISETVYSLAGFENCEIEGDKKPLRIYSNSGDILPVDSSGPEWQMPASMNNWIFKMVPNLYCGRPPAQRLKMAEEGRKTSFFFSYSGLRKVTFRVYPVGYTDNLSGKDLRVHLFWNNFENIGDNTINGWEEIYENNGWREIVFHLDLNVDTVVHYNLELTQYEANAYVLLDPVVSVEAGV